MAELEFGDRDYILMQGDALQRLREMPDGCVDCLITSPPYFQLRNYGGVDGQVGLETTPDEFVSRLVEIFREARRVMKDTGTLWVNIGDSYCNSNGFSRHGQNGYVREGRYDAPSYDRDQSALHEAGFKTKDLMGIPWMLAFALRKDGWYLRQDIIWCLDEETEVYAEVDGQPRTIRIGEMARTLSPERVRLFDGARWTDVLGWGESNSGACRLAITLRTGEVLRCTADHRWPLADGGEKAASELVPGDAIAWSRLPEAVPAGLGRAPDDILWMAGFCSARAEFGMDGMRVRLNADEKALVPRVRRFCEHFFDGGAADDGRPLAQADGDDMLCRTTPRMLAFLSAMTGSRGTKCIGCGSGTWRLDNAGLRQFAEGLLAAIRIPGEGDAVWLGEWLEDDLRALAGRLGWTVELEPDMRPSCGQMLVGRCIPGTDGRAALQEVVSIRPDDGRRTKCYDISVASGAHLFALASGTLTHNCKPNPMPESVMDRCTKAHEYIFMLSKQEKYYFDRDAIDEPASYDGRKDTYCKGSSKYSGASVMADQSEQAMAAGAHERWKFREAADGQEGAVEVDGRRMVPVRRKRDVWTVPTKSYDGAHFATFPKELVEPAVLAGCPEGGVVMDCFNGSGTTGIVAMKHRRKYVGIELNPEYVELTERRFATDDDVAQPGLF